MSYCDVIDWELMLKKQATFRKAYNNFNIKKVAAYTAADRKRLMADAGTVRNKLKINAAIENEFLMSIGILPGAHQKRCPVYAEALKAKPLWASK